MDNGLLQPLHLSTRDSTQTANQPFAGSFSGQGTTRLNDVSMIHDWSWALIQPAGADVLFEELDFALWGRLANE